MAINHLSRGDVQLKHAQDSHCSELFGILGVLLFLNNYIAKFQFGRQHSILVDLNNTSAMNFVFDNKQYHVVKSYYPDYRLFQLKIHY